MPDCTGLQVISRGEVVLRRDAENPLILQLDCERHSLELMPLELRATPAAPVKALRVPRA